MAEPKRIVIVGAGVAGATAAGTLRERGFGGEIVLIGDERHRPYALPMLTKGVLLGEADEPEWVHPEGYYAEHDIDWRAGTSAESIKLGDRVVRTSDGAEHRYDRLVLATGSRPRRLPVPGGDHVALHHIRTLDDSLRLRDVFQGGPSVVIVGGGWIGCEAAAAARKHGAEVTVVEPLPLPLVRVLGTELGEVFRDLHSDHGVRWRLGVGVAAILGDTAGIHGVRLADGTELAADVVVIGVGAAPRLELAHDAGLEITDQVPGGGLDVDAGLRTSAPDVFGIGDIAAHFHPRYGDRIRVEHWANGLDQGRHVAGNLIGDERPYLLSPFFYSDQYDLGLEYRGVADPEADTLVVRGEIKTREFIAFWLRDGKVRAALNVNSWDDGDALQSLVEHETQVDPARLVDGELSG